MKVKFLKDLQSSIGQYVEGEIHELEHDSYTIKNWIETGYCEEVKKRLVKKDETKPSTDK